MAEAGVAIAEAGVAVAEAGAAIAEAEPVVAERGTGRARHPTPGEPPIEQPLPPVPPSRITRWLWGSQAIWAPYRAGGLVAGDAADQPDPSQSQVSASAWPAALVPPNMTTSPVAGS